MTGFDKTGLGIGGAGRHNLTAETAELIARREMKIVERPRISPMPHGQLWEPCSICGQEPVCVDCEYCYDHCKC